MDSIFGIPAHPLFVHIPVVLIPLAAVGVVIMVIRPTWWERYKWATLAVAGVGMVGAIIAAGHTGAKSVWSDVKVGEGHEKGDRDHGGGYGDD